MNEQTTNSIKLDQQSQPDIENNNQNNNQNNKKYDDIFSKLCSSIFNIFVLILLFGILFSFPIAEFVMAEKYKSEMNCNIFFSPYVWMIGDGIVDIIINSLLGVGVIINITYNFTLYRNIATYFNFSSNFTLDRNVAIYFIFHCIIR